MKYITIILLLTSCLNAQLSHFDLTSELLNDMNHAIVDSLQIEKSKLILHFEGVSELANYMNQCLPKEQSNSQGVSPEALDSVAISISDIDLSMNRSKVDSVWNSTYVRQLELSVTAVYKGQHFLWQGKISDKLSIEDMQKLVVESYPQQIVGNYAKDQPALSTLILTTLSIFTIVAALYFMRT